MKLPVACDAPDASPPFSAHNCDNLHLPTSAVAKLEIGVEDETVDFVVAPSFHALSGSSSLTAHFDWVFVAVVVVLLLLVTLAVTVALVIMVEVVASRNNRNWEKVAAAGAIRQLPFALAGIECSRSAPPRE